MTSSWKTRECHFTWNLEENHKVYKNANKLLGKIQNNLAETHFLKTENLLFKACLQLWFKKNVKDALESLNEAKREIDTKLRNDELLYKGYKCVELLNRMWIEHKTSNVRGLETELETIELEEKDWKVVGAIKAAALMRLGPVMFDLNLELFNAAHLACPSNPDFLFGLAHITGQKMRSKRPLIFIYEGLEQIIKTMTDEEKGYWEKLIAMKPNHKGYHYAKSMLGLNLSRRDGSGDTKKALELLNEAYVKAPEIHEVGRNLNRFLKKTDLDRSISILETAISKQQDRTEDRHQLALCYIEKAKKEKKEGHQDKADEWTKKSLKELDKCLQFDSSHVYALLQKANQLKYLQHCDESPEDCYLNMTQKSDEFVPIQRLQLYNEFARYLYTTKTASKYSSRFEISQKTMDISTDESFEYQNEISGTWKTTQKAASYKNKAYKALKMHYKEDPLPLGILFYQNFEFDQAIDTLVTVDQTKAEVPYYLAKTYLKKGQEKTVGDQAKPKEADVDFARARVKAHLARELGFETKEVRKILADTALAIAHNELQVSMTDVIQLEDRCVTSYREAVRCGSLVAGLELMKLVKRDFIKITSMSKFIQILAEIDVCFSQPQSDALHAESKPLTFKEGLRSKETDIEPSMLKNRNKIKADINEILSKDKFYWESREGLFNVEAQLLRERFKVTIDGADGLQLDGREEGPLEDVAEKIKTKAVLCCRETRPLLDRIVEKFQKEELGMGAGQVNYFPLMTKETPETLKAALRVKIIKLCCIDMETHYPKIYECIWKLHPQISVENKFMKNYIDITNAKKHSNKDPLDIEPNPVKLARQSTDKVEEVCHVFFDTMQEVKKLRTVVEDSVSAIRQGGREQVVKAADELFTALMENEDFVVRMDTWKFLEMLALIIRHCREAVGSDVDLTRWTDLSERSSGFSKELRKGYLEVEAALLTNGGNKSSKAVLEKCHKTCREADNLLNKSLQSEKNRNTTFPFLGKSSKETVKNLLKKDLVAQQISYDLKLLGIILEAQPCSNEDNYRFIAMRKFLDDFSRGTVQNKVSVEKGTNSSDSYDILDLTRWCVNHAEKLTSKVMAHNVTRP